MFARTVIDAAVFLENAPPAMTRLHAEHPQIPTALRFTVNLPQKSHRYLECWLISVFLTTLRSDAP